MRRIINYIRSCFCNHEFEMMHKWQIFASEFYSGDRPMGFGWIYRCKKCGYVNKIVS